MSLNAFKLVLQHAVIAKALKVEFISDRIPAIATQAGQTPVTGAPLFSSEAIEGLQKTLMGADAVRLELGETVTNSLDVRDIGEFQVLATSTPTPLIEVYLPQGIHLFENAVTAAKGKISSKIPPPPVPAGVGGENLRIESPIPAVPSQGRGLPPPPPPVLPKTESSDSMIPPPPPPPPLGADMRLDAEPATPPHPFAVNPNIPDFVPSVPEDNVAGIEDKTIKEFEHLPVDMFSAPANHQADQHSLHDETPNKLDQEHVKGSTDHASIHELLNIAIERGASDLHLTNDEAVYLRIDGEMIRLNDWMMNQDRMMKCIETIAPETNLQEFLEHHDTDFAYQLADGRRFRVNLFKDQKGPNATLRQIPSDIPDFHQLGLPQVVTNFCNLNKGLLVVTGPTGSGKSTTLAAMIDYINSNHAKHILTIEDPIEFLHDTKKCLIHQREIGRHTHSFASGLRAALREDPDIILVGEMRDLETIKIAIETAETGHLVLGTLHTTSAVSTIDRIIDQFPAEQQNQVRMMLANSLKGVIAQNLISKVGGGRVAAHEILVSSKAVQALIREGKNHMIGNQMQTQKQDGNVLLNPQLIHLVTTQIITPLSAVQASNDKPQIISAFRNLGIQIPNIGLQEDS